MQASSSLARRSTIGRWCRRHCPLGQCIVIITVLTGMPVLAGDRAQANSPWRVVILDSSDPSEPVAHAFGRAIRDALTQQSPREVDIYSEFLDALRFRGAAHEAELVAFLRQKYQGRHPNLVVTVYPEAMQFLERHRASLWPQTPMVFVGVPDDPPMAPARAAGVAGVLTHIDVAGTIDLALRLQPGTRRVAVVSGASDFDRVWRTGADRALRGYAGRLEPIFLDGLAVPELMARIAELPEDTIVLYTTVFRDANGPTQPINVGAQLARASTVPVYGLFEPLLGTGILGGSMVDLAGEAERAGRLAAAIFKGATPESIPVDRPPGSIVRVDWRQMERFGFKEAALRPGALVLFRPVSFWSQYRASILTAGLVFALQSALIVSLLVERRQRRRAERRAHDRSIELAHASRLTAVGEITASIAHQINQPLGAIASNADAADMLLDTHPPPLTELRQILADIRRDDERAHGVVHGMQALLRRHEFQVRAVNLNEAVAEVLRLLDGEARRLGVILRAELGEGLPPIQGDRVHLQQVVLNLVMNGLEAARDGSRDRRVAVRTATADAGGVEVTVTDSGRGIPETQLARIFESFFTTKNNGMGLGLSIARSLVELHGGRIWAENSPQGGAVFRFSVPVEQTA